MFSSFARVRMSMRNVASVLCVPSKFLFAEEFQLFYNQFQTKFLSNHGFIQKCSITTVPQTLGFPCASGNQKVVRCAPLSYTFKRYFATGCQKEPLVSDLAEVKESKTILSMKERDTSSLLETWVYEVSPYDSLNAQLPFSTSITPLNPIDYPDMNKCIIELYYNSSVKKLPNHQQLSQISELYKLDVDFDQDEAKLNLNCDLIEGVSVPVHCHLRVPLKFGLILKIKGNESVSVESMESDIISVEADKGNVHLKKIKSRTVSAISKSGNIISESTQLGSSSLHCGGSGSISADKLQGSSMSCSTEMGSLIVKSLYTENATFKTVTGDIHLGQSHGQIYVVGEKTNLHIESQEGDLDVGIHEGSVNIHLSHHNKVDVDLNQGDISLSLPEGVSTDLNLNCPSIVVAENVAVEFTDTDMPHHKDGHIGERGHAQINARTMSGKITLRILSWIEATKFALMKEKEE